MFAIPIKQVGIRAIDLRETETQIPPSYQECGNKNEKEQHTPSTD